MSCAVFFSGFDVKKKLSVAKIREYGKELEARVPKDYRNEVYRKGIHLSSLWIPALIYFGGTTVSLCVFAFALIGEIMLEYGHYRRWRWTRILFTLPLVASTMRSRERQHKRFTMTGGVYVLASSLVCTLIFSNIIAAISLTVMLISDTLAALVGKAIGQRKIYRNKTLEGTVAFFVSALLIMMMFNPLFTFTYVSVIACFAAVFMELFEHWFELDDNFSIPLVTGIILTVVS